MHNKDENNHCTHLQTSPSTTPAPLPLPGFSVKGDLCLMVNSQLLLYSAESWNCAEKLEEA